MKLTHKLVLTATLLVLSVLAPAQSKDKPSEVSGRQVVDFDSGWAFHLGDIDPKSFRPNGDEAEGGAKGGGAWGAAAPNYDDSSWRGLNLPHDWVIEQPYEKDRVRSQGYRPRGIAWYRKRFKLAESDRNKNLRLQFDGIATHATVWLNGSLIARNWNGYTSFEADISSLARFGNDENTIAVRVDAEAMEGWWYEGGGIYRHVRLVKSPPLHIATDGIYVNPVKRSATEWSVPVEVAVENAQDKAAKSRITVSLVDPKGRRIAEKSVLLAVAGWSSGTVSIPIKVLSPRLWSPVDPTLYTVKVEADDHGARDVVTTRCGFRTLAFDVNKGFLLNGKRLTIKGVCNHQDHTGVGVAVPDSLWDFRIRKLKEMGANAYRCAHNPPSKEFLDACDRLGMLVMDENRHFNTSKETLDQLEWLVRRDRSHPSVFMWSLFNEENQLQGTEQGMRMAARMMGVIKNLDPTRPVTAAQNGGLLTGDKRNPKNASNVVDVVGINYQVDKYRLIRLAYPEKPILSSEDTSQVMTRGAFETDWQKLILSSYDDKYPGWAASQRSAWASIVAEPTFAGGFVWTGFDYHGEPSPFGWPAANSYFGCLDLCGFPKTAFYIRQALWVEDRPIIAVVPHWNWAGKEGQPIRVMVVTNAPSASLILNGRNLGTKSVDPAQMVEWQVPYEPGILEAVAIKDGKEIGRTKTETTGPIVGLRLTTDRSSLAGDGKDAVPITVEAIDAQGRRVPTADAWTEITVTGDADLLGVGNGDPTSHESEIGPKLRLFNGLGQLILRSRRTARGSVQVTVTSSGLQSGQTTITVSGK